MRFFRILLLAIILVVGWAKVSVGGWFVSPVSAQTGAVCRNLSTFLCGGSGGCRPMTDNTLRTSVNPLHVQLTNPPVAGNYSLKLGYLNDAGEETHMTLASVTRIGEIVEFQLNPDSHPQLYYKSKFNDSANPNINQVKMLTITIAGTDCPINTLMAPESYPLGNLPPPPTAPKLCNEDSNNNNKCSTEGGCPAGYRCEWLGGRGRCEKRVRCGVYPMACGEPSQTIGQCNYQGGCEFGSECRTDTDGKLRCVPSNACRSVLVCNASRKGSCGAAGGCAGKTQRCSEGTNNVWYCDVHSDCVTDPGDPPGGDPGDPPEGDPEDPGEGGGEEPPTIDFFKGPNAENFKQLNPFRLLNVGADIERSFSSPGGIITRALAFLWPLAGLALFFMLVWGGFEILSKANDAKAMEAGKQRITMAIIGFVLLFASFWIVQIISWIFGLSIL